MNKQNKKPGSFIRSFVIRFVPSVIVVLAIAFFTGSMFTRLLLPLFSREIVLINPEYTIMDMHLGTYNDQNHIIYTILVTAEPESQNVTTVEEKNITGAIPTGNILIHPIIIFTLLFAWPSLSFGERVKAAIIAVPLLVVVESVDVPILIVNSVKEMVKSMGDDAVAAHVRNGHVRLLWVHFLNNGGKQFLALLAFIVSIAPFCMKKPERSGDSIDRNDPCPCGSGKKYKNCCMR